MLETAPLTHELQDLQRQIAHAFDADGALAQHCHGYRQRPQQREMAQQVLRTLYERRSLVCEAGTGTGKTFAYLVPALICGGKIIVSTGTHTLQDQLFNRDLPQVQQALARGGTIALLKGRANYVCLHRLNKALDAPQLFDSPTTQKLRHIRRFAKADATGERSGCRDLAEDDRIWFLATSTRENCLGQKCPLFEDCFVTAARRRALAADVLVVNHHLFFADLAIRERGVPSLLPAFDGVIFDEAHQLPELGSQFFSQSFSMLQALDLLQDCRQALNQSSGGTRLPGLDGLEQATRTLQLQICHTPQRWHRRDFALPALSSAVDKWHHALAELSESLNERASQSEDLQVCAERALEAHDKVGRWRAADDDQCVYWAETRPNNFTLTSTPLSIADSFRKMQESRPQGWVFTSATLAVGEDFNHFISRMGLESSERLRWGSPFDYPHQSLLYLPDHLPNPNDPSCIPQFAQVLWPALQASEGRAFVLCASLAAMRRLHSALVALDTQRTFNWLLQGEAAKPALLQKFLTVPRAVLVGSASFWEGVDVRGAALSLVAIDRVPFAPLDDPVLEGRLAALKQQGRNPFLSYQLPAAALHLKQGVGRLIRDEADRGVLVLGDSRLIHKNYGRQVLAALPPMPLTHQIADVADFFAPSTS